MRGVVRGGWAWLAVLVIAIGLGLAMAVAEQQDGTLVVAGHSGQVPVKHLNGGTYVAVDALARLLNGSLSFQGNAITLTLPHGAGGAAGQPANQTASRKFSRDFLNSGIETMSDIREWRSALLVGIRNGYNTTDLPTVLGPYQANAQKNLSLASAAASTASDRSALPLLNTEFNRMQQLYNQVLAARQNVSYITVDAVENDPLNQKLLQCAHALGEMAAAGEFQDHASCH